MSIPPFEGDDSLVEEEEQEEKRRRRLLWLLLLLLTLLVGVAVLFVRYLIQPAPLPDLLPLPMVVNYAPHYVFSIHGVEQPVGVALSPQGDRIYVTETGGERLVKIFDRDGDLLGSFAPPYILPGERAPVYLATDSAGRVFVTDRLQHAVFVYDRDGVYLDTILSPDLTLSEHVFKRVGDLSVGTTFAYNVFESQVHYRKPREEEKTIPISNPIRWSPLGIHIDGSDKMLLTDVDADYHTVREIAASVILSSWLDFDPPESMFGAYGQDDGQLLFPNAAVADSRGRIYVTDSNNGRISVWDGQGHFLFHFGLGTGDGALNLPRGATIDKRDRLHIVDAVGQDVKVYDVSAAKPRYLFAFGSWGLGDGQFNYPNDIALDSTGRLYITDRENNRVQVWSY